MTQGGQDNNKRRRFVVVGLIALFVLAIAIFGLLNRALRQTERLEREVKHERWPVSVVTVKPEAFVERIVQSGIVRPLEDAQLNAEVSARVRLIKADLGDRVKKGQALILLDSSAYRLAWKSAAAQLADTRTMADLSRDQYQRAQKLAQKGHLSQEEFDRARSNADSFAAKVRLAEVNLDAAKRNLAETTIRAPFAGRISARTAGVGELVAPGAPIISVVKDSIVKIDLALSETQIKLVQKGMVAVVKVPAIVGRTFAGRATRIGVAAVAGSGAFPVRIEIENGDGALLSGMRATVEVELERVEDSVVITRDEVVKQGERHIVFVAVGSGDQSVAQAKPVVLGSRDGQRVRVVEGLEPGELLVVVGQSSIKDGSKLAIVERDGERTTPPAGNDEKPQAPADTKD